MSARGGVDGRAVLKDRARIVLWAAAIVAVVNGTAVVLARNHVGAVVLQLVVAEFGSGRLGVAWSDPLQPEPTTAALLRRIGRGAAIGASAAVVVLGALLLLHLATLEVDPPSVSTLFVGSLVAIFGAARDELLFRGLVLRALGPRATLPIRLGVGALAGAAAAWGGGAGPIGIASSSALAVAFTSLWIADRGAWVAVAAHAAVAIVLGPVASGGLLDVRVKGGTTLDETPIALVAFVAMAAFALRRALVPAAAPAADDAPKKSVRK